MQAVKEKVSNAASVAKEHIDIYKAKVEEKAEKASARNETEKEIAHERRKAKEAEAKMEMHAAKVEHKANKENAKHAHAVGTHAHHYLVGAAHPTAGAAVVQTTRPEDQLVATHEHHGHHYPPGALPSTTGAVDPSYPAVGTPAHHYPVGAAHPTAGAAVVQTTCPEDQLVATHEHHGHHYPPGALAPTTGAVDPSYPAAGYPPAEKYL
ncbi:late embryogenesis abundant protein 6 [Magnolia sinica]|uniref:late embryogenesis abundant protein 6 n=1 Tax=Magnolia sinica TaxID=86752 RepID=UPI00265ABCC4|nr:late embryogenesis abundant protein 6 [Magnolia sinica]